MLADISWHVCPCVPFFKYLHDSVLGQRNENFNFLLHGQIALQEVCTSFLIHQQCSWQHFCRQSEGFRFLEHEFYEHLLVDH